MHEIISAFGIDWRLIVIQIFNFALLLGVLWYFLYRPVLNLLAARQEKIAKGVADAEAAATKLSNAEEERQGIVGKAHGEAEEIVDRAREHAEAKGAALLGETQEKSARVLAEAEAKAKESKARALKESEEEVAKLAVLAAEKVLRTK